MTDSDSADVTESPESNPDSDSSQSTPYRVLARKYRPTTFAGLIGQEAMVRVLSNAMNSGRLAHAFMLTGVRGIGKTTTARIIARGLNCTGPDNDPGFGPTVEPCGICEHCTAIAEDRHVDVLEMDAASRTGVDDIRELIEGVRYRPTSGRYKVYIIDEVHMLSKNAFNALLKTLEEPPEHVKFIFATTEIRKVPVTVLSRCQRFDLRRVPADRLAEHFRGIAAEEGADIDDTALALIARAADGSVRDGLSLLDQAISQTAEKIDEDQVRGMLGLADRGRTFDLLEAVLKGETARALEIFADQYDAGADPSQIVEDLLEVTHRLTRVKVAPSSAEDITVPEIERTRGKEMAETLTMAHAARAWQILLKGLAEVRGAPSPFDAGEMVLIRLAHAASLPSPEEAVKALKGEVPAAPPAAPEAGSSGTGGNGGAKAVAGGGHHVEAQAAPQPASQAAPQPAPQSHNEPVALDTLEAVVALAAERREGRLQAFLMHHVRLVRLERGLIEFSLEADADSDMVGELRGFLRNETGENWQVSVARSEGQPTLVQKEAADADAARAEAATHPLVKAVLETFPGASVTGVERFDAPAIDDTDDQD
ncbi:MAG: DNA polymerase III subunit gamma/tau [Rhodospirillales bacterium]